MLEIAFDSSILEHEVQHLRNHLAIVSFMDKTSKLHVRWLKELQGLVAAREIMLHSEACLGFFYTWLDFLATTSKMLAFIPHKFKEGMAKFYNWIPSFNSRQPIGLVIPVWNFLCLIRLEFLNYVLTIASFSGRVIEEDRRITVS